MELVSLKFFSKSAQTVIVVFTVLVASHASGDIRCNETYYVTRGIEGIISCDLYASFTVIRWYLEGESMPVARFEGEQKFVSDGYDITQTGDMIIKTMQLEHEGRYIISGLDHDGDSSEGSTNIYMTVPLSADPAIESCSTSDNEMCIGIDKRKKVHTLVCSSGESRPAAEMLWYQMSRNGFEPMENMDSRVTLNGETNLFASSAILQYDEVSITLQQFNCKAKGVAVETLQQSYVLIEGTKLSKIVESEMIAQKGSSIQIKCSREHFILYRWKVIFPNTTSMYLSQVFPREKGHCDTWSKCQVDDDGTLQIDDVSYDEDGDYECLSTDVNNSSREITHLTVISLPDPPTPVIRRCEEDRDCRIPVSYSGSLQCTILKARPKVKLSWIADNSADIFLYNELTDYTENTEGTFDTISTVEYRINECSNDIHLWCTPDADSFHEKYPSAEVVLMTDTSKCMVDSQGRPGLIVFLVLLVIALIAICIILFRKREKMANLLPCTLQRNGQSEGHETAMESEPFMEIHKYSEPAKYEKEPHKLIDNADYVKAAEEVSKALSSKELIKEAITFLAKEKSERDQEEVKRLQEKVQKLCRILKIMESHVYGNDDKPEIIEALEYVGELLRNEGATVSSEYKESNLQQL